MRVVIREIHTIEVNVPTEDKKEAAILAEQIINNSDELITEYSHTLEPDEWGYYSD